MSTNNPARLLLCLVIICHGLLSGMQRPLHAEMPSPPDIPFSFQVLPNGLQLVVLPEPNAPLGVVTSLFRAGRRHIPLANSNIPHLLEHLFFSTPDSASNTFADHMHRAVGTGCQFQGLTTWTYTCYSSIVPPDVLPWLISLEGWRFARLHERFPVRWAAEREVLAAENWERENDLPDLVGLGMQVGSGLPDLSCVDSLVDPRTIALPNLDPARRSLYTSQRLTVVVAGPVSPAAVATWVAEAFVGLASSPLSPSPPIRPSGLGLTPIRVPSSRFNGQFTITWPTPERFSPEHPAYLVSSYLLRRAPELVARLGTSPCYQEFLSEHCFLDLQEDSGLHLLWGRLASGTSAERVAEQYAKLLTTLASEGPTLPELAAAKTQWQQDAWLELQTSEGRTKLLGLGAALAGDPAAWQREWAAVANVSASDVQAFVRNWLTPAQATFLVFVASETEPRPILPDSFPETSFPSKNLTFTLSPPNPGTASLHIPKHERFVADNGLEIWVLEDPYTFAGQAELIFPSGVGADPSGHAGLANLTAACLSRSLGMGQQSGETGPICQASDDGISFQWEGSPASLALGLQRIRSLISDWPFSDTEVEAARNGLGIKTDLRVISLARLALFGPNHPYSRLPAQVASEVKTITPFALASYSLRLQPRGAALFLSIRPDWKNEIKPLLSVAGAWPETASAAIPRIPAPSPVVPGTVVCFEKPQASKLTINHIWPGFPGGSVEYLALDAIHEDMGEYILSSMRQSFPIYSCTQTHSLWAGKGVGLISLDFPLDRGGAGIDALLQVFHKYFRDLDRRRNLVRTLTFRNRFFLGKLTSHPQGKGLKMAIRAWRLGVSLEELLAHGEYPADEAIKRVFPVDPDRLPGFFLLTGPKDAMQQAVEAFKRAGTQYIPMGVSKLDAALNPAENTIESIR